MSGEAVKVVVEIAVGEASHVSLADADAIVAVAQDVGVTAIRWVIDAPTTHNAPYNLARRILSLDRATGGRAGVVLLAGVGDEVSDAAAPDRDATDPADRWIEYARILTQLWESFPSAALLGDQENAVVAEDALIRPIDFDGRFYRVAGPLDGPSSAQGRPVLIATEPAKVGWSRVATVADAVIVAHGEINNAAAELVAALWSAGRRREEVALLARVNDTRAVPDLDGWSAAHGVDGIVIAVDGGAPEVLSAIRDLAPQASRGRPGTLRTEFAVPDPERVRA